MQNPITCKNEYLIWRDFGANRHFFEMHQISTYKAQGIIYADIFSSL